LTANTISAAHHSADTNGAAYTNSADHAYTNSAALVVACTISTAAYPNSAAYTNSADHAYTNSAALVVHVQLVQLHTQIVQLTQIVQIMHTQIVQH
jgi:hypothetical protein